MPERKKKQKCNAIVIQFSVLPPPQCFVQPFDCFQQIAKYTLLLNGIGHVQKCFRHAT